MIDIIIPAYNAHSTIKKLLSSIAMQKNGYEIKVYIIDDCSDVSYMKEYELFKDKLNLKIIRLESNKGPGYARQIGLNISKSKYVVFIDSDDYFYNYESIYNLKRCIEENKFDVGVGNLVEINDNEIFEYTVGFDVLHAKIYKRSFLKNNCIVFPEKYNSEDLSFNNLVMMCNPKINYVNENIYVYDRRKNSLTMEDNYYYENHIKYYVENLLWTIDYAEIHKYARSEISKIIISSFSYLYYYFYNNIEDNQISYIYELIPKYEEYECEIDIREKKKLVEFWVNRFEECPTEYSFDDFVSTCKKRSKKLT